MRTNPAVYHREGLWFAYLDERNPATGERVAIAVSASDSNDAWDKARDLLDRSGRKGSQIAYVNKDGE